MRCYTSEYFAEFVADTTVWVSALDEMLEEFSGVESDLDYSLESIAAVEDYLLAVIKKISRREIIESTVLRSADSADRLTHPKRLVFGGRACVLRLRAWRQDTRLTSVSGRSCSRGPS